MAHPLEPRDVTVLGGGIAGLEVTLDKDLRERHGGGAQRFSSVSVWPPTPGSLCGNFPRV